jgi:hypothetical protein
MKKIFEVRSLVGLGGIAAVVAALSGGDASGANGKKKTPHGGTPVLVAEHTYHLELVRDVAAGSMQAYVLDDELEKYVAVPETNFTLHATFAGTAGDGSHMLYETEEKVLAQDTDADVDVYDSAGTTALVSTGPAGGNGPFDAFFADVSDDGARAFFTTAESLVATDSDSVTDVYERAGGTTSVVSHGSGGGNGAFNASFAAASADSATAIFTTSERLSAGDTDSVADVYAARARSGYARPKGASPLRVALVPAYEPCTSPDRQHGPPLAFGSCAQSQQSSQDLTVGTPDANGQPVSNGARDIWVTETALTTALNMGFMAEMLSVFSIVVGVALLLTGIGLVILALAVFGRGRPETETATPAAVPGA